jgi:hypothetical protein
VQIGTYLSGWWASLLNHHGHVVLDSLWVYTMGALQLPPPLGLGDVLRGAFLWAGCEEVTGAMCMVSWDKSWLSKKDGGLGV